MDAFPAGKKSQEGERERESKETVTTLERSPRRGLSLSSDRPPRPGRVRVIVFDPRDGETLTRDRESRLGRPSESRPNVNARCRSRRERSLRNPINRDGERARTHRTSAAA